VRTAIEAASPEVVIDQLTSLPANPAGILKCIPNDTRLHREGGATCWPQLGRWASAAISCSRRASSRAGVYNVVDDDPLPIARWLPAFARWVGGPEPPRVSVEAALKAAAQKLSTFTPV
jgi:hypothetical protein